MIVSYTLKEGTEITEEQKEMIRKAKQMPIVYDEDSPEMDEKISVTGRLIYQESDGQTNLVFQAEEINKV